MILYNVTINIDKDVEQDWLQWMKESHIPEVMKTGLFESNQLYRMIGEIDNGGNTYSVQYFAHSMREIDEYLQNHAPRLRQDIIDRYENKHVVFRTVLESVD